MGNFGGFNRGGMGNMQQLMKQAQKMQQDMLKAQDELKDLEVTGSASGGMVEVTMTCDGKMTAIKIKPEVVDPEDVEMLEDLITAAYNDASEKAATEKESRMGQFGGLGI